MSGVSYLIRYDKKTPRVKVRRLGRRILRAAVRSGPRSGAGVNSDNTGNFAKGWRVAYQFNRGLIRIFNNVGYSGFVEGGSKTNPFYKNNIRDIIRKEVSRSRVLIKTGRRSFRR